MSIPSKVQAITFAKNGDFDVIEKTEIPFRPDPKHVIVKVEYGGVNFIDTYFRKGLYPTKVFPGVSGNEAAGRIVALPTDTSVTNDAEFKKRGLEVGHEVAAYQNGVFAEYIAVPWTSIYPVPESVSTKVAAAALVQGITTVTFMREAYEVKKGDTIFVHTVAGGLGLLMVQVAKSKGATVIGTTSTPEKAQLAKDHGADHVILYKDEDVVKRTMEITNGVGVDAVFDGVGKDTIEMDFEILKRKGSLISVGNASGAVPPFPPLKLTPKNLKLARPTMANYVVTPEESLFYGNMLYGMIADGSLKINIFKEYPFTADGVIQAQKDLTGGHTTGKLVVKF